ncbi:MAG: hypothetical protein ACR652_24945 [Methylocystis sp.]|uniref:hypothetical protein n=1 Tax=Methylocystis sp. TaxID=1911079 RepID=UPI003DA26F06
MRSLANALFIVAVVIFASEKNYGLNFVFLLCGVIALRMLWLTRLRAEVLMFVGGLPNRLGYWIFIGGPLGFAGRMLALALVLAPIYILAP